MELVSDADVQYGPFDSYIGLLDYVSQSAEEVVPALSHDLSVAEARYL